MNLDEILIKKYWHPVAHRKELPCSGDFIRFKTVTGDVVVFNDDGEIKVFDNICPHRGAYIFNEDCGNQPVTCKYHGWTFKNGKAIVPNESDFIGCQVSNARLNEYRVDWCGDFVFFSVDPIDSLYMQLGEIAEILENISFNISESIDYSSYEYECYWPIAVENALEPYHISLIHPNTLSNLELSQGQNVFHKKNSIWYSRIQNNRVNKRLTSFNKFFNIDYSYDGYMSIFIFPFSMISSTYGFSYSFQNFFPLDLDGLKTSFTSRLYGAPSKSDLHNEILKTFFKSTADLNRKVFEEDHSICKIVSKKSWSHSPLKFENDLEIKISHFRNSCREVIS